MAKQITKKNFRMIVYTEVKDQEFFGANGGVSRVTKLAANEVLKRSQAHIGKKWSGDYSKGGKKLKDSGKVVPSPTGGGDWMVQFEHRAAAVHHEGSRAHVMDRKTYYRTPGTEFTQKGRPKKYRPGMGFGPARNFKHPGHTANRYLTEGARDAGLRVNQTPGGQLGVRPGLARVPRGFV